MDFLNEPIFSYGTSAKVEPFSIIDKVNNQLEKKKKEKEENKKKLNEWGGMKKIEKTDELKLQWRLLQHQNLYVKGEYHKLKKDEPLPDFFQVATLVNGNDKLRVGAGKESQSLHTSNRRRKKVTSELNMLEKNDVLKDWCIKKYTKIQTERNIGSKSFVRKQRKELLRMKKSNN